mmetsp:Transcript_27677/g.31043  ORF Transcript_27677/g.31043 Transcript_27677/m.31043 type:complete len:226 (+) Transcript_27677:98-775(+)
MMVNIDLPSYLLSFLLAVQLISVSSSSTSCPGFRLGGTSCSKGIFSSSSVSASCSDDGDIMITGTVTAKSSFDSDSEVTFVPCVKATGICFHEYAQSGGNICNLISASDGSSCGSAGKYSIDQEFDIPDEVTNYSWLMSFVTIRVLIGNEEACTQDATSSSSSSVVVGVASLFAVGGISLFFMRRRRKPLIVLEEDAVNDNHVISFVQMKDMPKSNDYYSPSAMV